MEMPLYHAGVLASATPESMKAHLDTKPPSKQTKTNNQVMSLVDNWSTNHRKNKSAVANTDLDTASIEIILWDQDSNEQVRMTIELQLHWKLYSTVARSSEGYLWGLFGFLMMTRIYWNKTPAQLGMNDLDSITVSMVGVRPSQNREDILKAKSFPNSSLQGKKKKKKKRNTTGKTKKS